VAGKNKQKSVARYARDLARRSPKRDPYNKVLIVCEGGKTEPNYFNELINYHRINSANVKIDGSCGSSPKSIVKYGYQLYEAEKKKGDAYDQVFCVFDKDSHDSYHWSINFVTTTDENIKNILAEEDDENQESSKDDITVFNAITSVPCFEFWVILHFIYTTKPYASTGSKSSCDCVINDLKKHINKYKKSEENLYSTLYNKIDTAKNNAIKANKAAKSSGTDNPTTLIQELVDILQNIKKPPKKS